MNPILLKFTLELRNQSRNSPIDSSSLLQGNLKEIGVLLHNGGVVQVIGHLSEVEMVGHRN